MLSLDVLPTEIKRKILSNIASEGLARCLCLSHLWHDIASDPILWKNLLYEKKYQKVNVSYLKNAHDVFYIHYDFLIPKFKLCHPLHERIISLCEIANDTFQNEQNRALSLYLKVSDPDPAKKIQFLKAVLVSRFLTKLLLTKEESDFETLLCQNISEFPELILTIIYGTDIPEKMILPSNIWDIYNIVKHSKESIYALLTDSKLKTLKIACAYQYNGLHFRSLIYDYPEFGNFFMKDPMLISLISISCLKRFASSNHNIYQLVKSKAYSNQDNDATYQLFIMDSHTQPIEDQFEALQKNETVNAFLEEQNCNQFHQFLNILPTDDKKPLFELSDTHSRDGTLSHAKSSVQVISIKGIIHMKYLASYHMYIKEKGISQKLLTLSELVRLTQEEYEAVFTLINFLSIELISAEQLRQGLKDHCKSINLVYHSYEKILENSIYSDFLKLQSVHNFEQFISKVFTKGENIFDQIARCHPLNLTFSEIRQFIQTGALSLSKATQTAPEIVHKLVRFIPFYNEISFFIDNGLMGGITMENLSKFLLNSGEMPTVLEKTEKSLSNIDHQASISP